VRAVLLLAVVGIAVVYPCGAGAATRPKPIQFGFAGGNVLGYSVSIKASGTVTITRGRRVVHRKIRVKRVRRLGREIRNANLAKTRICAGTLPDFGMQYVRYGGRTFRLRGTCEPRFEHVWNDLVRAVGGIPR